MQPGDVFHLYAVSDRQQAKDIRLFADGVEKDGNKAKADLMRADAAGLDAHAAGWDEFAEAVNNAAK